MDLNVMQMKSPSLGKGMTEDDDRKEKEIRTQRMSLTKIKDWKAEWLFVNDSIRERKGGWMKA